MRLRRDLSGVGLILALAVASGLLLRPRGDDGLIGLPDLEAGEVAPRTVRSSRTFTVIDPALTAQARGVARDGVRQVFDHLLGLAEGPKARLRVALASAARAQAPEARAQILNAALGAQLGPAEAEALIAGAEPAATLDAASMLLDELFGLPMVSEPDRLAPRSVITVRAIDPDGLVTDEREQPVDALGALGPNQARARVDALAAERLGHLGEASRRAVARVVKSALTPNFVPNAQETLQRRRLAWLSVKPSVVLVRRGERVIRAGERITARDLLLVRELARLESPQSRLRASIGGAILGALLAWLGLRVARHGYRHRHPRERDLVFLASTFVIFLLFVWLGYKTTDWLAETWPLAVLGPTGYRLLVPVAAVVVVVRSAAGAVVATAAAAICAPLAGFMMDGSLSFAVLTLAGGLAAASVRQGAPRMVLSAGLRAGFAQAAVVLGTTLLSADAELGGAVARGGLAFASGLLAAPLARAGLPAVEALFGYTTPSGLAAFANEEHPLLRELLVEVPGTYHHSLHVGALADAGARAIGADRLLARVGGYFHDVGRLRGGGGGDEAPRPRPERARALLAPSTPGAEPAGVAPLPPPERRRNAARLAAAHRFPAELSQILMEQPHEQARSAELDGRRPRPRSKTSALVFLADWVEDALHGREGEIEARAELEALVRAEVREATGLHLLDDSDLELRELAAIGHAFAEALAPRFLADRDLTQDDFRYAPPPSGAPS